MQLLQLLYAVYFEVSGGLSEDVHVIFYKFFVLFCFQVLIPPIALHTTLTVILRKAGLGRPSDSL